MQWHSTLFWALLPHFRSWVALSSLGVGCQVSVSSDSFSTDPPDIPRIPPKEECIYWYIQVDMHCINIYIVCNTVHCSMLDKILDIHMYWVDWLWFITWVDYSWGISLDWLIGLIIYHTTSFGLERVTQKESQTHTCAALNDLLDV